MNRHNFYVLPEQMELLRKEAAESGTTVSHVLRRLIDKYLKRKARKKP